jgi:hypothetical membrane protein
MLYTHETMTNRVQVIASGVIVLAALMVLIETLYFASLRPNYSHISNTISELGETGAPHARLVAFSFFLPVGLLVWLALWLVWRESPDRYVLAALIALSSMGAGYALSAFFPCDSGAPFFGTWRTFIHNLVGFIDYAGTGIGFLIISRHFARRHLTFPAFAFLIAGALVLLCLALLSLEAAFHIRGAVQRIAEILQFIGVFFVCYLVPKKSPDTSLKPTK